MSREEKLAHGAKIAKKIKTIAISPRQQGMRIMLPGCGTILITRDDEGFVVLTEPNEQTDLFHYAETGRACKVELTKLKP